MKRKQQAEASEQSESREQPSYQTGSTQPPKSHSGVIACLLVLVIFLCGISTALSVMNFRLLELLETENATEPAPVVFSRGEAPVMPDSAVEFPLGFAGQAVPAFWQDYHGMPAGIYVAEVADTDAAWSAGLRPGDILTGLDGVGLTDEAALQKILEAHKTGDILTAQVSRENETLTVLLTME